MAGRDIAGRTRVRGRTRTYPRKNVSLDPSRTFTHPSAPSRSQAQGKRGTESRVSDLNEKATA